jgi:hypothetical protein
VYRKFRTWGVVGASVYCVKLLYICSAVYSTCVEVMLFCCLHWPTNFCNEDMGVDVLMLKVSNEQTLGRLRADFHA